MSGIDGEILDLGNTAVDEIDRDHIFGTQTTGKDHGSVLDDGPFEYLESSRKFSCRLGEVLAGAFLKSASSYKHTLDVESGDYS